MGQITVDAVVQALQEAQIRVQRACPGQKMPLVSEPVAAVQLEKADMRAQTMSVLVTVVSPAALGCEGCEAMQLQVGTVLTELGGECTARECTFDGRMGLFTGEVLCKFLTAVPQVTINGVSRPYVEAFTCWRTVDDEITDINDAPWQFRLEEFFPTGTEAEEELTDPFTLVHFISTGSQSFLQCQWTYERQVWGSTGIRQIRLGAAKSKITG